MRYDIYGRYALEVVREGEAWAVYRLSNGNRRPERNLIIPSGTAEADIEIYFDDMLHELAQPGKRIHRIE